MKANVFKFGLLILATSLVAGCNPTGFERFSPDNQAELGNLTLVEIQPVRQHKANYCGGACLEMVGSCWGMKIDQKEVGEYFKAGENNRGIRIGQLSQYARGLGMNAFVFRGDLKKITDQLDKGRPVIVAIDLIRRLGWHPGTWIAPSFIHFLVVIGYDPVKGYLVFADPYLGLVQAEYGIFLKQWQVCGNAMLVMTPRRGSLVNKKNKDNQDQKTEPGSGELVPTTFRIE